MKPYLDARVSLALGLTIFFWASAFAGIRVGLESYSPGHVALLRFLVASAALVVYAVVRRMRLPEVRDLPAVVLSGFLAFTLYSSRPWRSSSWAWPGEAPPTLSVVGGIIALLGVLIVNRRPHPR